MATTKMLEIASGGSIAYDVYAPTASATKAVAVCLPGMGDFRQSYRFLAPALAKAGMRVISADLRGTGASTTNFKSYSVDDVASDVISILDQEKISDPVVVLGNSFSAAVAVFLSVFHKERVAAIVGLSGFYRDMPSDTFFRPLSHLLFTRWYGTAMWLSYFKTLFASPPADLDSYISTMQADMAAAPQRAVIIGRFARASKSAAWDAAKQVPCPALLLLGERDPDFKDQAAELETVRARVAEGGAVVEAKLVPGAGHYPQAEQAGWVEKEVLDFLKNAGIVQ